MHGEGTTGVGGVIPAFPAQWCYGLYALSLGTGLFCSHRPHAAHGGLRTWCQRRGTRTTRFRRPQRLSRLAQKRLKLPRPSHPAPNVRDDREAPLNGRGTSGKMLLICPTRQAHQAAADWRDGQFMHDAHARIARRAVRSVGWARRCESSVNTRCHEQRWARRKRASCPPYTTTDVDREIRGALTARQASCPCRR